MKNRFRKLFSLYPGEERNAALFAILGYLWMFAAVTGLKFADVLFLVHIGAEELPTVYTLNAVGMMGMASLWMTAFSRISAVRVSEMIILTGITLFALALFIVLSDSGENLRYLWYGLRIAAYLFFTIVITAFWIFVDQYHHIRDAKRLYCLFSSAIFAGSATTGAVMRSGAFTLPALLLLVIATLIVVWVLLRYIAGQSRPVQDSAEGEEHAAGQITTLKDFMKGVIRSPYTLLLMGSSFLIELYTWTTEYSYLLYFENRFSVTDSAAGVQAADSPLAHFLGQLILGVGIANLFFGLFFFNRIVRRFGVYSLLPVSSLILFFSFANWLHTDLILFPILGFFVVEGTRWVIDDNSFNLLLGGVPTRLKYQVRVATEHFFEPIAMLISGVLLGWMHVNGRLLTLGLATVSLGFAMSLRMSYFQALYANLSASILRLHRGITHWFAAMSTSERAVELQQLRGRLESDEEIERLLACEGLLHLLGAQALDEVVVVGSSLGEAGRLRWLQLIKKTGYESSSEIIDCLYNWAAEVEDSELEAELLYLLARQGVLSPLRLAHELDSPNLRLRGAALLAVKTAPSMAETDRLQQLEERVQAQLQLMIESTEEETVCMALEVVGDSGSDQEIDLLMKYLKHNSLPIARIAAQGVAKGMHEDLPHHGRTLLKALSANNDTEFRFSCMRAMRKVKVPSLCQTVVRLSHHFSPRLRREAEELLRGKGLSIVPSLIALLEDTSLSDRCRILAARLLGHLAPEQLRQRLHDVLTLEIQRAYFYFYHFHTLQIDGEVEDLTLVREALHSSLYSALDYILHLLSVAGSLEDYELLSQCLRSTSDRTKSQVVEALEKTCTPAIFSMLEPLVESLPIEHRLAACERMGVQPASLAEVLEVLAQSPHMSDRIVAVTAMRENDIPQWRRTLRQQMKTNEPLFHHFAYELLEA